VSGTGVVAPFIEGEFDVEDNPYYEQHVQGEIDYLEYRTKDAIKRARAVVRDEFVRAGLQNPRQCPCGKQMWYRATVGAYICGNIGPRPHMATWSGEVYRNSLEMIEQEKK